MALACRVEEPSTASIGDIENESSAHVQSEEIEAMISLVATIALA